MPLVLSFTFSIILLLALFSSTDLSVFMFTFFLLWTSVFGSCSCLASSSIEVRLLTHSPHNERPTHMQGAISVTILYLFSWKCVEIQTEHIYCTYTCKHCWLNSTQVRFFHNVRNGNDMHTVTKTKFSFPILNHTNDCWTSLENANAFHSIE